MAEALDVTPEGPPPGATESPEPSVPKRRRLAQDVAGKLLDKLHEFPQDVAAWKQLIAQYKSKDRVDELVETYEKILSLYPLSGEIWTEYVQFTLGHADFAKAEQLFARSLTKVPYVPLWSAYIDYVRRVNPTNTVNANEAKAYVTIAQAYEFALSKIQYDPESGRLWKQYVEFLENKPSATAWDQQQKMDEVRKTYRRAVSLPLANIETLWRAYNTFENDVSRSTARKFIDERSGAYMLARSCVQTYNTITSGLDRSTFRSARKYDSEESVQLSIWHRLVTWELTDPLKNEDPDAIKNRVLFTYRQAAASLPLFPEVWFDAAEYCVSQGLQAEAIEFLQQGLDVNPGSFLLTTRLGDLFETTERRDDTSRVYKKLISYLQSQRTEEDPGTEITLVYAELMKATKRGFGVKAARAVSSECRKLPYCTFQIYTASAFMELHNKDATVAGKIYEIGYKKFRGEPDFIKSYLEFLFQVGDETNARVVFEKALAELGPSTLKDIYDQFLKYEASYGDLTALSKMELRYLSLYPQTDPVELYSRRFRSFGADPIGQELRLKQTPTAVLSEPPVSVKAILQSLPPAEVYDGPEIKLGTLADLILQYA